MTNEQINEYLVKYKISSKEDLANHIQELKRNTIPNTRLISELVYVLEDSFFSLSFGEKKLNTHISEVIKVNSTRHKSQAGETHKEIVGDSEGVKENLPPYKSNNTSRFKDWTEKLTGEKEAEDKKPSWKGQKEIESPFFLDECISTTWLPLKSGQELQSKLVNESEDKIKKERLEFLKDKILNNHSNSPKQLPDIVKIVTAETEEELKEIFKSSSLGIGQKHNKYKLPMSKLFVQFPDALQAIVLASCYGHHCYPTDTDWLNFKRVEGGSQNYKDAGIRHSLGAEKDEESNLPEIFHQAWNKLAELQLWLEENKINIKDFSKNYLNNLHNKK